MSSRVETLVSTAVPRLPDDADFAARLAESQRRVFHIALSVLANPADAEEVAQETFLRAHCRFATLREPAKFRTWVSRIAFRLALNCQRAQRRQRVRESTWQDTRPQPLADPARQAAGNLLLDRLRAEIHRLPESLRLVLLLSAVEGMDAREVGAVLAIPAGTVRSRLHRARKILLEAMS